MGNHEPAKSVQPSEGAPFVHRRKGIRFPGRACPGHAFVVESCHRHVWRQLDPALWELTHNPWVVLQTVSREKLQRVLAEPAFRKNVDDLVQARRNAAQAPAWFQQTYPQSALRCVAYFSMEFMLSEALPIYSGGLGNVAGDQLKSASDLGVPVIGVGLLYQQGYFRQVIDKDGAQQALFPYNDPGQLPITPLRQANGEWLRLEIALPGYSVWLRAWQVQVGRVKLYLLDSNDAANLPGASRHYQRAIRRRAGVAPQAGNAARDRRMATARGARHPAGSLPLERRTRGPRGIGARPKLHGGNRTDFRGRAGGHPGGQSFHHPHGGGRRLRSFCAGPHRAIPRRLCRAEAWYITPRSAGPGTQQPERFVGTFQHGLSGDPGQRRGEWREPPAWQGEPAAVRASLCALAAGRHPSRTCDQRRPHADLGLGGSRRSLDGSLRKGPLAGDGADPGAGLSPRIRRQSLAISHRRPPVSG